MKISIIIPIYNSQKYIKRCVDSILKQTYNDIEIILVNDGSTDRSGEICEEYSRQNDKIKVIHMQNNGPSTARNKGLAFITGDYVGFVDSDDWVDEDMYKNLIQAAYANESDIICCGYKVLDNSRIRKHVSVSSATKNYLLSIQEEKKAIYDMFINSHNGLFCIWNKLYKAKTIRDNHILFPEEKTIAEDCEFNISFVNIATKYTFISGCYYNYFMTTNSLTRGYIDNYFKKHLGWRSIIENNIPKEYVLTDKNISILNKMTIHEIIYSINQDLMYKRELSISEILKTKMNSQKVKEAVIKYNLKKVNSFNSILDRIFYTLLKKRLFALYYIFFKAIYYIKNICKSALGLSFVLKKFDKKIRNFEIYE